MFFLTVQLIIAEIYVKLTAFIVSRFPFHAFSQRHFNRAFHYRKEVRWEYTMKKLGWDKI